MHDDADDDRIVSTIFSQSFTHSLTHINVCVGVCSKFSILQFREFWLKLFTFACALCTYRKNGTTKAARRQLNLFYTSTHLKMRDVNEDWEEKIELNLIRSLDIHPTVFALSSPLHHRGCPFASSFRFCRSLRFRWMSVYCVWVARMVNLYSISFDADAADAFTDGDDVLRCFAINSILSAVPLVDTPSNTNDL